MKRKNPGIILKIIAHPIFILSAMSMILVVNESSARFLFQLYLSQLPHLTLFSLGTTAAILIFLFSYGWVKARSLATFHAMNGLAILLLMNCLLFFFVSAWERVYPTFQHTLSLMIVLFASVILLVGLGWNISRIRSK